MPIGPTQGWEPTSIQLHATIGARPSESTIDVVVRVGIGDGGSDDLWWPLSGAAVLHAALGELISAIDQPLDAAGCPTWCVRHEDCEPDRVDPDSLASVIHSSASISVPSSHMGEFAIRIESDIDTDGGRIDDILICEDKVMYALWRPDRARAAHSVLATALDTAATDPRVPPAAIAH